MAQYYVYTYAMALSWCYHYLVGKHTTLNSIHVCPSSQLPCLMFHSKCSPYLDCYGHLYPCRNADHLHVCSKCYCPARCNAHTHIVYRLTVYVTEWKIVNTVKMRKTVVTEHVLVC